MQTRLQRAAKAVFAKANEGNLKPETIESLWPSQHLPHWSGLAEAAITAYLQAVGPEPAVAVKPLEWVKHPSANAWRADNMLGTYQVWVGSHNVAWQFDSLLGECINETAVDEQAAKAAAEADYAFRIRSALVATPPAEPVVEAPQPANSVRGAAERVVSFDWSSNDPDAVAAVDALRAALATKPAVKDDEHLCPICAKQLQPDDLCASDIELGICHAECLEGCPTVDLETGEQTDGPIDTYRYGEPEPPNHNRVVETAGIVLDWLERGASPLSLPAQEIRTIAALAAQGGR